MVLSFLNCGGVSFFSSSSPFRLSSSMMITTTQEVVAEHPDAITLFAILLFALLLAPATVPGQVGISQAQGQNT